MGSGRWTTAGAAVAALVALGGCGGGSGDASGTTTSAAVASTTSTTTLEGTTTSAPAGTGSTTTSTTIAVTTTVTEAQGEAIAAGTYDAYVKSAGRTTDPSGKAVRTITYDQVQLLTGKAAVTAAHERHLIPPTQDYIDNDYIILNDNTKLRTAPVAEGAAITIDGCGGGCGDQVTSSVDGVATLVGKQKTALFKVTVTVTAGRSTITAIHQTFLP